MNTFGKNIGILYRQLNLFLNRELSDSGLTSTDLMYLGTLFAQDGVTQDDLARDFCIDKAATARSMQSLEKKGIILRKADEKDRRAKRVYLTEKAYTYQAKIEEIQGKWISVCNMNLSEEELNKLEIQLEMIANHVKMINGEEKEG